MVQYDQETNAPMISMDTLTYPSQTDPPAYSYSALTPSSSRAGSPRLTPSTKVPLLPPPPRNESVGTSHIPRTPSTEGAAVLPNISIDPILSFDTRFAELIVSQIILPRLRVGVLRWKDRESFAYIPQSKDDVIFPARPY